MSCSLEIEDPSTVFDIPFTAPAQEVELEIWQADSLHSDARQLERIDVDHGDLGDALGERKWTCTRPNGSLGAQENCVGR